MADMEAFSDVETERRVSATSRPATRLGSCLPSKSGTHALGNWILNPPAMYPRLKSGLRRDQYLHRAVFEDLAGRPVKDGFDIHHQNFNKLCVCPHNLVELPKAFNPARQLRCPWTGKFLTAREYMDMVSA